jgi:uncharacterized membrane protein
MTKTKNYLKHLTDTLWFVPAMFVVCGILSGIVFVWIDFSFASPFRFLPEFFGVQPSGARDMMAIIAGSIITVAGTVFSITIVALTLASTQFSPRILRNFMRDTGNQAVLGALVGIFAYCIVVLRTIRDGGDNDFVPATAVFVGVVLGFVGVGCLIYFIHHVATSIQATSIISQIAWLTIREIKSSFPEKPPAHEIDKKTKKILTAGNSIKIAARESGYVQNADIERLISLADERNLILKMRRRIGQFSIEGLPILEIYPRGENFRIDPAFTKALRETYDISDFRTIQGDVAFGLRQIVDIALKALSPSINDTTTAITCIDYLTSILVSLATRPSLPSYLFSGENLRLVVEQQRFEDFFDLAFNQIRQNAGGNVAVILRQLNSINILSLVNRELPDPDERRERHELMKNQAELVYEMAARTVPADTDLAVVSNYFQRIQKSLSDEKNEDLQCL